MFVTRFGDDEFTIMFLETSSVRLGRARNVYGKGSMVDQFKPTTKEDSLRRSKSPSLSVAEYRGDANSGDVLIEATDQTLYRAMRQECNWVVRFHAGQAK
jgi:GGDEF domain-containing protein